MSELFGAFYSSAATTATMLVCSLLATTRITKYYNAWTTTLFKPLLWTTNGPHLSKVRYDFKRTNERPERLLYRLLTSIQAIQTRTIAVSDLWRYQLINRSKYELKNLSLIWKSKVPPHGISKTNSLEVTTAELASRYALTPYQVWACWGKYRMITSFYKNKPLRK